MLRNSKLLLIPLCFSLYFVVGASLIDNETRDVIHDLNKKIDRLLQKGSPSPAPQALAPLDQTEVLQGQRRQEILQKEIVEEQKQLIQSLNQFERVLSEKLESLPEKFPKPMLPLPATATAPIITIPDNTEKLTAL